jgi:hypothetical protein
MQEILTSGGLQLTENSLSDQLMKASFMDQLNLSLLKECGRHGHQPSVGFLFGWCHITNASTTRIGSS